MFAMVDDSRKRAGKEEDHFTDGLITSRTVDVDYAMS